MARRPPAPPPLHPANLTIEQMRRGIARLSRRIDDLDAFNPRSVQRRWAAEVKVLEKSIEETLVSVFGHDTLEYKRYHVACDLDGGPVILERSESLLDVYQYLEDGRTQSIALLRQAIRGLEEEIADREQYASLPTVHGPITSGPKNKVFVVHGHDEAALQSVARFMEQLGLEAIILREQPDQGRTIIEKFEDCAREVGFAVVLMTPDDIGQTATELQHTSRARQNVIFELGYFAGKLGRGRACLLRRGDVEIPSDLYGVIYTDLDVADGWKLRLVRELKAAGLDFDANRMWV
jgi:predicted nucleotide-binding protein